MGVEVYLRQALMCFCALALSASADAGELRGGSLGWRGASCDPTGTPGEPDVGRSTVHITAPDYAEQEATCSFRIRVAE